MGRHFIPSSEPGIFLTSTQFSNPSSRCAELRPDEIRCTPSPLFIRRFPRRVMRAWWSSRSSKPLHRHFVPGGRFDSYPLRQTLLNLQHKPDPRTAFAGQDVEIVAALHAAK